MQRQQPENGDNSFRYRLYGVVVHGGSLDYGHYTACVRVRTVDVETARTFLQKKFLDRDKMTTKEQLVKMVADNFARERLAGLTEYEGGDSEKDEWFEISDSTVREIHKNSVLQKQAYLLFYERVH